MFAISPRPLKHVLNQVIGGVPGFAKASGVRVQSRYKRDYIVF
jgi:hypothetical protein